MNSVYTEDDLNLAFDILGDLLPLNYTEYTNGQISFQETRLGVAQESAALINSHVSNAVNKATADLRTQLAERDAQLAAMRDTLVSIYALIPTHDYLCYGTSEAAMRGFLMLITHKCQAILEATRQPTQDKGK